jgi:hypothetical protein
LGAHYLLFFVSTLLLGQAPASDALDGSWVNDNADTRGATQARRHL